MPEDLEIASVQHVDGQAKINLNDGSFLFVTLDQLIRLGVPRVLPPPETEFEKGLRQAVKAGLARPAIV